MEDVSTKKVIPCLLTSTYHLTLLLNRKKTPLKVSFTLLHMEPRGFELLSQSFYPISQQVKKYRKGLFYKAFRYFICYLRLERFIAGISDLKLLSTRCLQKTDRSLDNKPIIIIQYY